MADLVDGTGDSMKTDESINLRTDPIRTLNPELDQSQGQTYRCETPKTMSDSSDSMNKVSPSIRSDSPDQNDVVRNKEVDLELELDQDLHDPVDLDLGEGDRFCSPAINCEPKKVINLRTRSRAISNSPGCETHSHTKTSGPPFESDIGLDQDRSISGSRSRSSNHSTQHVCDGNETFRFSDLSISSDDEDDHHGYSNLLKQVDFLLTSSLSSLSDDQDSASRLELMENLSDQSALSSDDSELYNDWDSGLSNFNDDNLQRNPTPLAYDSESEIESIPELDLPFPHRARHDMECEICLKMSYLRRRVCCDFQICNKCLATYITLKVKEGKVQMECPNDRCDVSIFKAEIHHRLSTNMREKFTKYLIDANADPYIKTCPSCSQAYHIDAELLNVSKRKLKNGVKVTCSNCKLVWCFPCQAPFHNDLTCKKYKKEDEMVKRWAKEKKSGQANAQKCPKCKIFIQKKDGCDHMQCSQCNTDFCYRCGDRYISIKLLGNHWSRFSLFGCKYRLLPQKPALRRLIRGTNFGARLVAAVVLAGLGVAAGAVLLGASVFILPGYGILQLRRNMWARKKRKKFLKQKMLMLAAAQREKDLLNCRDVLYLDAQGYMSTIPEESETETSNPTADPQQIQVLVHRSVSFNKDDAEERSKDCDVLVNKYISDGSEVFVSRAVDESTGVENTKEDDVIMVTDVQEIKSESGYSTVVCNIISKANQTNFESEENKDGLSNAENKEFLETELELCNVEFQAAKIEDGAPNQLLVKHQPSIETSPHNESSEQKITSNDAYNEKTKKRSMSQTYEIDVDESFYGHADKKHIRESEEKLKEKEEKLKEKEEKLKEKEEKLKEKEEKLKEKEEKLKEKEVSNILSKSKNNQEKAPLSEVTADKTANNGCFGNIFSSSKRAGSPPPLNQESCVKNETKPSKTKDIFSSKSATWEKCRRTNVDIEPMSKASLDLSADIKQLPYYIQKSPSSLSSIISFSYGIEEEGKAKGSEPLIPVIKMDAPMELGTKSASDEHHQLDSDASLESGYVSQCNFVTYL